MERILEHITDLTIVHDQSMENDLSVSGLNLLK
jgi:hypothetical protein